MLSTGREKTRSMGSSSATQRRLETGQSRRGGGVKWLSPSHRHFHAFSSLNPGEKGAETSLAVWPHLLSLSRKACMVHMSNARLFEMW